MLHRAVIFVTLVGLVLLCAIEMCVATEPAMLERSSFAVLRQKVAAAVARDLQSGLGGESCGDNLQVPVPAPSVPLGADLHVTFVRTGYSPGSWLLRLDCSSRRDCLPFHVVLYSPGANLRQGFVASLEGSAPEQNRRNWPKARPKQLRSPVARSGDHVLLVEDLSGMRLKVTVVCLESAGLGDEIRVRNLATHRVLLATVAGKDLVRVER